MLLRSRVFSLLLVAVAGGCAAAIAAGAALAPPTLKASPRVVAFGSNLLLTGTVPSARKGERVHLLSQPCGFTAPAETQQAKTTAKGAFRFKFQPAISTIFRVTWVNVTSRQVRVVVRPLVQLKPVAARQYSVDVSAGAGSFFKNKKIVLQRAVGKRWVTVAVARLKQKSSNTAIIAVSSATITARVRSGSRLRAFLSAPAAAPCYGASASAAVRG
jgi:hypothetical protein